MASPRLTFYFDIGSPFSYIAFHVLKTSPIFANCEIEYVPVLLKALLQQCQNPPPIGVKNKFQWIQRERLYWARRFGLSMTEAIPQGFPASTVDVQAALALVFKEAPEKGPAIAENLFSTFWADADTSIVESARFAPLLRSELEEDLVRKAISVEPDVKQLLDTNTQRAFVSGAFGLPWFECVNGEGTAEGFWGVDHFGRVAEFLHLDTNSDPSFRVLL